MKSLILGIFLLTSLPSFATGVCLIQQYPNEAYVACNTSVWDKVGKSSAKFIKERLEVGYELKSVVGSETYILYTLIKK